MNILMLKLKLQYFGQLMWRVDSLGEILMLGKIEGRRKRGWQRTRWLEWDHWFKGHEFEQALGDGEGQGILACCSPWGHRVGHDWETEHQQHNEHVSFPVSVQSGSTTRVSESVMQRENEKHDTWVQWKARIRGPRLLQGEGAKTESFTILSAMKERMYRELSYNSCGLQGQRTKWSLTIK